MSIMSLIDMNTNPLIPVKSLVYWNPIVYMSSQSLVEYEELKTNGFLIDNMIEIHYVNDKNKEHNKIVEVYRFPEYTVNLYNHSFLFGWSKLEEEYISFNYNDKTFIKMFDHIYIYNIDRGLNLYGEIPESIKIGYICYLKNKFKTSFPDFVGMLNEYKIASIDTLNYKIGEYGIFIENIYELISYLQ